MKIPRARIFLYSVILLVVVATAAELVGRWWQRGREPAADPVVERGFLTSHAGFVEDDHLFWRMPPNQTFVYRGKTIITNSHGLRDDEFSRRKPRGEWRVLCLGESGTFGEGVAARDTYSEVLERRLQAAYPDGRFQVVNAGLPSYTSFQMATYLERVGLAFSPDLVIVYSGSNDQLPSYFVDRVTARRPAYGRGFTDREVYERRFAVPGWPWLRHSAFVRLLAASLLSTEAAVAPTALLSNQVERVPLDDRVANLTRIVQLARAHGAEVLFLVPPYGDAPGPDKALRRVVRQTGAPLLNLRKMRLDTKLPVTAFFSDGMHPNVRGHRLCGDAIFDFLQEKDLLPAS